MASPAVLAFNRHVIPLISKFPENDESSYTPLTRVVALGGDNTEKRKYNVPIVSTSSMSKLFVVTSWSSKMFLQAPSCP